jgi:hypothetical protein
MELYRLYSTVGYYDSQLKDNKWVKHVARIEDVRN